MGHVTSFARGFSKRRLERYSVQLLGLGPPVGGWPPAGGAADRKSIDLDCYGASGAARKCLVPFCALTRFSLHFQAGFPFGNVIF